MLAKGTRARAIVGSFVFFWLAPAVVAGVGPFALFGWAMQPPLFGLPGERVLGGALIATGLACLLDSFARFALEGRGTPAPFGADGGAGGVRSLPVRAKPDVCVLVVIAGQALLFGQAWLFAYAGVVMIVFQLFVRFYEEPQLRRRFGKAYVDYCLHVGRWWPRLTPWRGSGTSAS